MSQPLKYYLTMHKNMRKNESERLKRKTPENFKFSPNRFVKLSPTGNITNGTNFPKPRSGHRIVFRNGDIYSFGGYAVNSDDDVPKHVLYCELWKFNLATKAWKRLPTHGKMPDTLASHCACLVYNQLLVFGGTGVPFGETVSDETYACDLDTLEWTVLETTGKPPKAQYGQAMCVNDNKMYVVGGTNGFAYSIDVHCLDLETYVWEKLKPQHTPGVYPWEPTPRYRHEIAVHDNQIFVFGGGASDISYEMKEIPVFEIETRKWKSVTTSVASTTNSTSVPEHPDKRRCHGLIQFGSDVFLCGGVDGGPVGPDADSAVMHSDAWRFSMDSLQWTRMPHALPTALFFHAATVSESGQMFVFGGVNSTSNTRTNDLLSMWVTIPSLAEMAWAAFHKYVPDVVTPGARGLHRLGVPTHFIRETDFEKDVPVTFGCCSTIEQP